MSAQHVHPGALELVQCPGLRGRQQSESRLECAGVQVGLRGRQGAVGSPCGVPRQRD
jgi:hypothetical protein